MDFAILTKDLGRIYKIRGSKKSEAKTLTALQDVSLQVQPGVLAGTERSRKNHAHQNSYHPAVGYHLPLVRAYGSGGG